MAWCILFDRIRRLQTMYVRQIVKPFGIVLTSHYSTNIRNKPPPETNKEPTIPSRNIQQHKLKVKKISCKICNIGLPALGIITLSSIGIYLILILGAPEIDVDGKIIKDDLSNETMAKQYMTRTYRELKYYYILLQKTEAEKLLPDPLDAPYNQPKYTLVLEFTDVLVHPEWTYSSGWRYKKRPLVDHFLKTLDGSYEIVVYTAEQGRTVFSLMDVIDPNSIIAYKLVRGTTLFTGFTHVKQLNNLNRDLKKVICIDWDASRVKFNPENLLNVKRWTGRDDDTSLLDLATFLKTIADNKIEDVRDVLIYYSKYNDPVEAFRKKQQMLIEELDEAAKKDEPQEVQPRFNLFS